MALDYDKIMQLKASGEAFSYTDRETILYALSVGFGRDPMNADELPFVYENGLRAVPTMGAVIAPPASVVYKSGINFLMVVHGEQRLTLHRSLPIAADVVVDDRVAALVDKGEGKGALLVLERLISLKNTGEKLCTLGSTIVARGDGGFGGPKEGAPEPHKLPDRAPDLVKECDTREDQSLLYALLGDRNPLHRDPAVAKMAGYPRPILHGLCTYGTACRAIVSTICNYNPEQITGFDVRFSRPIFPGETIVTEMWVDGRVVSFRSRVKERDVIVLNNGKCTLGG